MAVQLFEVCSVETAECSLSAGDQGILATGSWQVDLTLGLN